MAKFLKFHYEFKNILNVTHRVEIWEEAATALTVVELEGGNKGFTAQNNNDVAEKYLGGIVPTVITIDACCTNLFNTSYFSKQKYGDYVIKYIVNGVVKGNAIITPFEGSDLDLMNGYPVTLGAECGIKNLKTKHYAVTKTKKKLIEVLKNCLSNIPNIDTFDIKVIDNTKCYLGFEDTAPYNYWEVYVDDSDFEGLNCLDVIERIKKTYNQLFFDYVNGFWCIRNVDEVSTQNSNIRTYSWANLTFSSSAYNRPVKAFIDRSGGSFSRLFSQQSVIVKKSKSNMPIRNTWGTFDNLTEWTFSNLAGLYYVIQDGRLFNSNATFSTPEASGTDTSYMQSPEFIYKPYLLFSDNEKIVIEADVEVGFAIQNLRFQIITGAKTGYAPANFLGTDSTWYTDGYDIGNPSYAGGSIQGTPIFEAKVSGKKLTIEIPRPPYQSSNEFLLDLQNIGKFGYWNSPYNIDAYPVSLDYYLKVRIFLPERKKDYPSSGVGDTNYSVFIDNFNIKVGTTDTAISEGFERKFSLNDTQDRETDLTVDVGVGYPSFPVGTDSLFKTATNEFLIKEYGKANDLLGSSIDNFISNSYLRVLGKRLGIYTGTIHEAIGFSDLFEVMGIKYRTHNATYNARENTTDVKALELNANSVSTIEESIVLSDETIRDIQDRIDRQFSTLDIPELSSVNFSKVILSSGRSTYLMNDDLMATSFLGQEMLLRADDGGVIKDVSENTAGNFTLTKPAKTGTYALLDDIDTLSWKIGGNVVADQKIFGTTSGDFDIQVLRNNTQVGMWRSGGLTVPNLIGSELTASELIATDANKKLVSLAVATYPSLTELTYIKGVTSSIQTQIDSKFTTPTGLTTNCLPKWNGSTFTNSQVFDNGTNVGIGLTTPIYKLHVYNSAFTETTTLLSNIVASFASAGSGAASTINLTDAVTYNAYIGMQLGNLHFGANTTNVQMTLLASGNLGVNIINPLTKVDIAGGGLRVGTNVVSNNTDGAVSIGDLNINWNPTVENWTTTGSTLLLNGLDYSTIGFHDGGNRVDYIRVGNGKIQLGYNAGFGEPDIIFPSSGVWKSNGSVGVGTLNPIQKVDIVGNININAGNAFMQNNSISMLKASNYNIIANFNGGNSIYVGGTGDPNNYYDNTGHYFRDLSYNYNLSITSGKVVVGGLLEATNLNISNGASVGKYWVCTNASTGAGAWTSLGSSGYLGTWNANTNTPSITNGVGTAGTFYIATTAGTWNGITFAVNDEVWYNGTTWEKIARNFTLQTATASVLGGIKVGSGLSIDSGTGVLSVATLNQNTTGSAATLSTTRNIAITGDLTWNVNFNGSANVTAVGTLANVATVGTYRSVTINAKGLVTSGTNPTTLIGYGITDAASGLLTGYTSGAGTIVATDTILQAIQKLNGNISGFTGAFVDLTTNQTVGGIKTFSDYAVIQGIRIHNGGNINNTFIGNDSGVNNTGTFNVSLGLQSLKNVTNGQSNVAVGAFALTALSTGISNVAIGRNALGANNGSSNVAIGHFALLANTTASRNTAIGNTALGGNRTGGTNVAIGASAGAYLSSNSDNTNSSNSIYIGADTVSNLNNQTNQIVIGNTATSNGSNTVTIGNGSIIANFFNGSLKYGTQLKPNNVAATNLQVLSSNGTQDSWVNLTTSYISNLSSYTGFDARYYTKEQIGVYTGFDARYYTKDEIGLYTGFDARYYTIEQTLGLLSDRMPVVTGTAGQVLTWDTTGQPNFMSLDHKPLKLNAYKVAVGNEFGLLESSFDLAYRNAFLTVNNRVDTAKYIGFGLTSTTGTDGLIKMFGGGALQLDAVGGVKINHLGGSAIFERIVTVDQNGYLSARAISTSGGGTEVLQGLDSVLGAGSLATNKNILLNTTTGQNSNGLFFSLNNQTSGGLAYSPTYDNNNGSIGLVANGNTSIEIVTDNADIRIIPNKDLRLGDFTATQKIYMNGTAFNFLIDGNVAPNGWNNQGGSSNPANGDAVILVWNSTKNAFVMSHVKVNASGSYNSSKKYLTID